jgi:TnpA family transposase
LAEIGRSYNVSAATNSRLAGQFFQAGGRGEAIGDVNARHGNEPGVAFYTHVSDSSVPSIPR